jgi:hypothetical protein
MRCPLLWLPVHVTDEKFSVINALEHSDQQLQVCKMTEDEAISVGSCFIILTENLFMWQ